MIFIRKTCLTIAILTLFMLTEPMRNRYKEKFLQIILSKILKNVYFCNAIKIEKNNTYKYII